MPTYEVDRDEWARRSIFDQMGNIGSEVGRAIAAHRRGNAKREAKAVDRAFDLFDATIACLVQQRSPRAREVLVARDEFAKLFFGDSFDRDADALERYFAAFAVAARKRGAEGAYRSSYGMRK